MTRGRGARPLVGLALLLLAGAASAQPLMSQAGDLLMMLTKAIDTVRDFRNSTVPAGSKGAGGAAGANLPGPISSEPFSARILKLKVGGGNTYEWNVASLAFPRNVTVGGSEAAQVTFKTRYSRSPAAYVPYFLKGTLELRNLRNDAVKLQGPVKVLVTLRRAPGVTTGPAVLETTHYASCGKSAPTKVAARRNGGRAGITRCNFEAALPQALLMMRAAEAALADALGASAGAGGAALADAEAAAKSIGSKADAFSPEAAIVVQALPHFAKGPMALNQPYKAAFDIPEGACVAVGEKIAGALSRFIQPTGSFLPSGVRVACEAGASRTSVAKLGGFDASACGAHPLTLTPFGIPVDAEDAGKAVINVVGCNRTLLGRPDMVLTKLEAVRVYNHTWSVATQVTPQLNRTAKLGPEAEAAAAAGGTLVLAANGYASADYTMTITKNPVIDLGNRIRGEVAITTTSMVPELLPTGSVRIAVTSPGYNATYLDAKCPPVVGPGGAKCTFDAPWTATTIGSVQAQLKSLAAASFDVNSGTKRPFDFSSPQIIDLGACVNVDRAYLGESDVAAAPSAGGAKKPLPLNNLVNGVDALLGAVRVDLTRYGLPKDTFGELLGLGAPKVDDASRRRLMAPSDQEAQRADAAAKLAPALHALKLLSGAAPPPPGSGSPLRVCKSQVLSWTEQFGGVGDAQCATVFSASQALSVSPNGTAAGAQPPIVGSIGLPVLVASCDMKPAAKLLALRATATKAYSWTVSNKYLDKKFNVPQSNPNPVVARYRVVFNRTSSLTNYTLEPAVVLLNHFAAKLPVSAVYATIRLDDAPNAQLTAKLVCKGQSESGALVLPAAASASEPVPVGCVGSIQLPGPSATGTIVVTTETPKSGNVTSDPSRFDLQGAPVDVTAEKGKCITVEGGFSDAVKNGVLGIRPVRTNGPAIIGTQELCEPRKLGFSAEFGPFTDGSCGNFVGRYVVSILGLGKTSSSSALITVHSCKK